MAVKRVVQHPEYNAQTLDDIVLLELREELEQLVAVDLPEQDESVESGSSAGFWLEKYEEYIGI